MKFWIYGNIPDHVKNIEGSHYSEKRNKIIKNSRKINHITIHETGEDQT